MLIANFVSVLYRLSFLIYVSVYCYILSDKVVLIDRVLSRKVLLGGKHLTVQ